MRDLLRAQGRRWNPKKRSWEKCEDYGTELAALREIAKILDIYPGEKRENKVGVKVILSPGCPRPGGPVLGNGEQSIGTAAGDGREHRERWKETGV